MTVPRQVHDKKVYNFPYTNTSESLNSQTFQLPTVSNNGLAFEGSVSMEFSKLKRRFSYFGYALDMRPSARSNSEKRTNGNACCAGRFLFQLATHTFTLILTSRLHQPPLHNLRYYGHENWTQHPY